ncbi:MAG: hypothetical protein MJ125_06495 [Clostridia bacterium]|nr:hypothetical protein [Clostridia bacterium]
MTKKIISVLLAVITVAGFAISAAAYSYIDRDAVVGEDFSVSWNQMSDYEYDMCIYAPGSGSPTYVNFNQSDIVRTGNVNTIPGSFLKAAVQERAAKDGLSGVVTFELRINEDTGDDEDISYSLFTVDLNQMKVTNGKFNQIDTVELTLDFSDRENPVKCSTPHVAVGDIIDGYEGIPFSETTKTGDHTLDIYLTADEGYYIFAGFTVTVNGKEATVERTDAWHDEAIVVVTVNLTEDEVNSISFFTRIINAIKSFFRSIADFFRNIFAPAG